jgi:predicted dehydrogenase
VEQIRVGVVGAGYFGRFHAEKYAAMEEADLVGIVDVDASRAGEVAKRCGTRAFSRISDLFGRVQAVSIAVPTPFHYAVTRDFFLRGIDVLLEKPIARTLREADRLIGLAESNGRVFQVGHLERFNGAFTALEGIIRNPLFIETHRLGSFTGRSAEVGVVLDLMIHDIDLLFSLAGGKATSSRAVGAPILTGYLDMANARIEFDTGCTASLTVSRVSEEKVRCARIFQPDGTLFVDFLTQKVSFSKKPAHPEMQENPMMSAEEIPVKKVDPLESEIRSFLDSVRNRKKARVSGEDGKRALEMALQIIREINKPSKKKKQ